LQDIKIKEFEWYLRDHLFRQSNRGILQFQIGTIVNEIATQYLRYRNTSLEDIHKMLHPVIDNLISKQVITMSGENFMLEGTLSRLQCSKCYYICYLGNRETRNCLRCSFDVLHEFPRRK
jgi:hypothetical protein